MLYDFFRFLHWQIASLCWSHFRRAEIAFSMTPPLFNPECLAWHFRSVEISVFCLIALDPSIIRHALAHRFCFSLFCIFPVLFWTFLPPLMVPVAHLMRLDKTEHHLFSVITLVVFVPKCTLSWLCACKFDVRVLHCPRVLSLLFNSRSKHHVRKIWNLCEVFGVSHTWGIMLSSSHGNRQTQRTCILDLRFFSFRLASFLSTAPTHHHFFIVKYAAVCKMFIRPVAVEVHVH